MLRCLSRARKVGGTGGSGALHTPGWAPGLRPGDRRERIGSYRFQANFFNLTLKITEQRDIPPDANGRPLATFTGVIREGAVDTAVRGMVDRQHHAGQCVSTGADPVPAGSAEWRCATLHGSRSTRDQTGVSSWPVRRTTASSGRPLGLPTSNRGDAENRRKLSIVMSGRLNHEVSERALRAGGRSRPGFGRRRGEGPGAAAGRIRATVADGEFFIIANHLGRSSFMCLDVPNGDTRPNIFIQLYPLHSGPNQRWRLRRQPDGSFEITNVHSGLALDVPGS